MFDETNFMTSEQDTNNLKIDLAKLEDDEEVTKEQDQRANREQQIQEETKVPDQVEQPKNEDQQDVPNLAVPRKEQNDPEEAEQHINQVSDPVCTTVPIREFVPKP